MPLCCLITVGCAATTGSNASVDKPSALSAAAASDKGSALPKGRLPAAIRPLHYELLLNIDPRKETFSGETTIRVQLDQPHSTIWLHGQDLQVEKAKVIDASGKTQTASWSQKSVDGVARLDLPQPLAAGEVTLSIAYEARFDHGLSGLYRVSEGGEQYAFTQFEAIHARQAFPCFDEPAFKVPFHITLVVSAKDVAASNTPIVAEEAIDGGQRRLRFASSKPMPTYLVAFAVGPFDIVEAKAIAPNAVRSRTLPLRGLAVRGKGSQLAHALRHGGALLAAAESYFGTEYPYEKLDIVAVPDFSSGAMENVGLVTFRESLLLLGENAPEWQERAYADVMAHELAHMWFGNLVTMSWWDDLWLNEAFASWMGAKIVEEVFPEHQAGLELLEWAQGAMRTDSLLSARQIRQPITSNHDIENAFDSITYGKGGAVLAMVESWLGEEPFRRGVRRYLEKHRWGNARTDDLIAALSEAAGSDVGTTMRSFLEQPGVPLVRAAVRCEDERTTLALTQKRYFPLGSAGDASQTWSIPICIRFDAGKGVEKRCFVLNESQTELELDGASASCPSWILPNADGAGYYRFALEGAALGELLARGFGELNAREQLALADSLDAAFESGAVSAADLLDVLPTLAKADARSVATAPMGLLRFAHDRLLSESGQEAARRYSRSIYLPLLKKLGWTKRPKEDGETALFRGEVIAHLALFARDPAARREALRRAHAFTGYGKSGGAKLDPKAVDTNIVETALSVAVQEGDEAFFDHLLGIFEGSQDTILRSRLLRALGSAIDPKLAARARALALDPRLRVNETGLPLRKQSAMPETRQATWKWIVENTDALIARMGDSAGYLPYYGKIFCDRQGADDVRKLFEAPIEYRGQRTTRVQTLSGGPRNLRAALEGIDLCAAQVEHHRESAKAFFESGKLARR